MASTAAEPQAGSRELVIDRVLAAPRAAIWRCWTEPVLLERWFCPAPWRVTDVEIDLRPGGASSMVMRGLEGEVFPTRGVYLEVVPERRLVFTDAYIDAWQPSEKPFFTGIVDLSDAEGGSRYHVRARHWTEADREAHETMGFHEGWNKCADQLEALARTL